VTLRTRSLLSSRADVAVFILGPGLARIVSIRHWNRLHYSTWQRLGMSGLIALVGQAGNL
jgi:hypothetical protein